MGKSRKEKIDALLIDLSAVVCFLGSASACFMRQEGAFLDNTEMGMARVFEWVEEQIEEVGKLTDGIKE